MSSFLVCHWMFDISGFRTVSLGGGREREREREKKTWLLSGMVEEKVYCR